jgi:hypothetical protein
MQEIALGGRPGERPASGGNTGPQEALYPGTIESTDRARLFGNDRLGDSQGETMTEVDEFEIENIEIEADDSIREAMQLIDRGLGDISERQLVSTSEVADLLLDVRTALARLNPEVSAN